MQPSSIQNIDLNDSVVINEDRTGEDYHKVLIRTFVIVFNFCIFFNFFEKLLLEKFYNSKYFN